MVLKFTPLSETAPVTSERPVRRQETPPPRRPIRFTPVEIAAQERQLQTEAGNIEFNAALANTGGQDALFRLGYTDETGVANYVSAGDRGFHVPDNAQNRRVEESGRKLSAPRGSVNVGGSWATPAVWNHEFRHRGFQTIINELTPEEMIEIVGPEAYRNIIEAVGAGGIAGSEAITEIFDNPEDSAGMVEGPDGEWVNRPMSETIGAVHALSEDQRTSIRGAMNTLAEVVIARRKVRGTNPTQEGLE